MQIGGEDRFKRRVATAILAWNLLGGGILAAISLLAFHDPLRKRLLLAVVFAAFGILSGWINRRNYLRSTSD